MKLQQCREAYYLHSGKASDIARQLSFAGIALIWIFKIDKSGSPSIPEPLLVPAGVFVVALFLDLLQYAAGSAIWGAFARYQERYNYKKEDSEVRVSPYMNWPALGCFWLKLAAVLVGYGTLFVHVWKLLAS